MSWRTVIISSRAKLDYKMNYLIIRREETSKIYLNEISTLIIENTGVSLTAYLLSELIKRKIKVIFCDEKRNPQSELISYYGSHDCSAKIKNQINWDCNTKKFVWTEVVREKIYNQMCFLRELSRKTEAELLESYLNELEFDDATNREGFAAKVYFNALFGHNFTRTEENNINAALNYGYTILLSAFNREITANGYLTQIGIFHDSMFNSFNLASDLMEPYRILVDREVYWMDLKEFTKKDKQELVDVLNKEVVIDGKRHFVNNAITIYCKSVFNALNENDISHIRHYRYEL
ncbi:MAG: type II CRISPR-associated endonuclease Cas1 [Clostridia bacterium]|jgi:CRISPR-associated protein Cas1